MGRLRLMGAVLHGLELEGDGRAALATLTLDMLLARPAAPTKTRMD